MTDKQAREAFREWVDLENPSSGNFIDDLTESFVAGWQAASQQNSGWQDIETAPKDGRPILAYEKGGFMGVAFWGTDTTGKERWLTGITKTALISGLFLQSTMSVDDLTHFMPLPTPPKENNA